MCRISRCGSAARRSTYNQPASGRHFHAERRRSPQAPPPSQAARILIARSAALPRAGASFDRRRVLDCIQVRPARTATQSHHCHRGRRRCLLQLRKAIPRDSRARRRRTQHPHLAWRPRQPRCPHESGLSAWRSDSRRGAPAPPRTVLASSRSAASTTSRLDIPAKELKIRDIADLRGKRIAVGPTAAAPGCWRFRSSPSTAWRSRRHSCFISPRKKLQTASEATRSTRPSSWRHRSQQWSRNSSLCLAFRCSISTTPLPTSALSVPAPAHASAKHCGFRVRYSFPQCVARCADREHRLHGRSPPCPRLPAAQCDEEGAQRAWLVSDAGSVSAALDVDFPLSDQAQRFYQSGIPFLYRYLPFWLANLVERLWVLVLPLVAIVLPLMKLVPPLYAWRIRSRVYRWYGELKFLEQEVAAHPPPEAGSRAAPAARPHRSRGRADQRAPLVRGSAVHLERTHSTGPPRDP